MRFSKEQEAALDHWRSTPLYLTPEGLKRLKDKLTHLENILPGLISETQRTRAYGDTSDNSEYKDAKMNHRRVQRQIRTIQDQLKKVVLIEPGSDPSGKAKIGSQVTLEDKTGSRKRFLILGPAETNPGAGRISMNSPVGRAVVGRRAGEEITVQAPKGEQVFKIISIE